MDWIREVSLVRRVTIGFGCCAAIIAGIGGGGVWALQGGASPGAQGTAVWLLGGLTVAGCLFAWALVRWHASHPKRGLPENLIVLR